MQQNPLQMTPEDAEIALEAARGRVQEEAVRALGSEEAVDLYERLRRRAERIGQVGDAAFDELMRFEAGLTDGQRRLLFGDRNDPCLEPEELEEVRRAFEPALLAEGPGDIYPELRRHMAKVDPNRLKELASLSGVEITRRLSEIVSAIRVREAVARLKGFGVSDAEILRGVLEDFRRQGVEGEDARMMIRKWIECAARRGLGCALIPIALKAGPAHIEGTGHSPGGHENAGLRSGLWLPLSLSTS